MHVVAYITNTFIYMIRIGEMIMKNNVNILFSDYDDEHFFALIKRESKNLFFDLGVCSFEDEMAYWDMPTKLVDFNGEPGYLFNNELDKDEVKDEINRFIKHNNI